MHLRFAGVKDFVCRTASRRSSTVLLVTNTHVSPATVYRPLAQPALRSPYADSAQEQAPKFTFTRTSHRYRYKDAHRNLLRTIVPPSTSSGRMPPYSSPTPSLPEHNSILLTRELLLTVLYDLSLRLSTYFPSAVRLVVHGGAVMVLHPLLACRDSTRDVDYIHRSFEAEWIARGVTDAGARLLACIKATARKFKLGADWMNACADRALPVSQDVYGRPHDPICTDALSANNVTLNTIFTSPGLVLVGVGWAWAVALKLVRYDKYDPHDIASILRLGQRQRNVRWTRTLLEAWLLSICGAMGYAAYPPWQMEATRQKMRHAIALACSQESTRHLPSLPVMRVY